MALPFAAREADAALAVHSPARGAAKSGEGEDVLSRAARTALTTTEIVIVLFILVLLLLITIPQFTRPTLATVSAPDSVVAPGASGPIAIKVTRRNGSPQRGVTVRFETDGHGSVTPAEARTDSTGVATATWRAAPDTGDFRVTARAAGRAQPEIVLHSRVRGTSATPVSAPTP